MSRNERRGIPQISRGTFRPDYCRRNEVAIEMEIRMTAPPIGAFPVRPLQVTVALGLFAVGLGLGAIRVVLRAKEDSFFHGAIPAAIVLMLAVFWLYGLHRRKRWLWWLTVIGLTVGVLGIPWDVKRQGDGFQLGLYYVQCAVDAPATVLLWLASARRWFHVSAN
jgi:hypothetical protein